MDGTKLKICGITNADDMKLVNACGADYAGILVDVGYSERSLDLQCAQRVADACRIQLVVLLCNPTSDFACEIVERIKPGAIQLLCVEPPDLVADLNAKVPCQIWKSIHFPAPDGQHEPRLYGEAGADALLIDRVDTSEGFVRMGGTGKTVNWLAASNMVKSLELPVFLSGGIDPNNIADAIAIVRPFGIDLCSGVESTKGKKDPEKLSELAVNFHGATKLNTEGL